MKRQTHTRIVTNGQQMATAAYWAKKTGRSWFVLGTEGHGTLQKVVDSVGRRGYEQYYALEITPEGEYKGHEANPRQPKS